MISTSTLLLYKILQLFIVMALGFIIVKLKVLKSTDALVLSKLSLYILMPATIINSFNVKINKEIVSGIILAFGAAIILHAVFLVIDFAYKKLLRPSPLERASVFYPNAGNLIIPLVSFILGGEWVIYSTAFLSVQLVFIWTHGVKLFSKGAPVNLKKIILNPNIIAIAVGAVIMVSGLTLPSFASDITSSLGSMIGNVGMLIAGMTAAQIDFKKMICDRRIYIVTAMRMLVCPAIVLILLRLCMPLIPINNAENILLISFLATITPSAASVMQFAQVYDCEAEKSVAINILTTLACCVTMPVFVFLLTL